ncbi:hypothetical protein [Muriicola sp. Z0-33]|uniref:hypothetical protein n=1 Tax=Muriicola sp. Z0-33 TaxID=2816957 RepID=UPI0022376286|nr:hypothetical protein [Muriicola sp. Z0-33]MCW5515364.1 hypothetical protein [Muriicola sp. Z0-33]
MTVLKKFPCLGLILLILITSGCVQTTHQKSITFKVDMNAVDKYENVGLRGSFTSPPWEVSLPMKDDDKDGIYEFFLKKKTAQNSIEFKYIIVEEQFELEGRNNRVINFEYRPQQITYTSIFDDENGNQNTIDR